jgi:hypothetical protein
MMSSPWAGARLPRTVLFSTLCALIVMPLLAAAASGCGGEPTASSSTAGQGAASSPVHMAGTAATAAGGGGAGATGPAATFTAIYEMLFPMPTNARCNACHANPANDVGNGKLQTGADKASAYAALVGKTSMSSRCMNRPLVLPGQPEMSLFYLKLMPTPPCGVRMPNGGNQLTAEQIDMVRSWIAAGAKDD